jgi:hypothetical protein
MPVYLAAIAVPIHEVEFKKAVNSCPTPGRIILSAYPTHFLTLIGR